MTTWFSATAVLPQLRSEFDIGALQSSLFTSSVLLGFVLGTVTSAVFGLADRIEPRRFWAASAIIAATANILILVVPIDGVVVILLRLITGICMAGIYPIGMKLMVGWAPGRTGLGLAWLVGMLVLGTALPHALHGISMAGMFDLPWASGIWGASLLAMLAGLLIWRLGEAPQVRASKRRATAARAGLDFGVFTIPGYRRAAGGYFGHMWELYTLWALLPLLLASAVPQASPVALALGSFALIAIGGPGCWLGGWLSQRIGSRHVAMLGLAGSGTCCLIYPWITALPAGATLAFLGLWSALAVVDSAHFSALSALAVPTQRLGTALTLQNATGFGISVLSLVLLVPVWPLLEHWIAWLLLPGPLAGLWLIRQPITDTSEAT